MTKILVATKCKDGWYVEVKIIHEVKTESEVLDIVRYEGLKVIKMLPVKDRIYAR